MNTDDPDSIRVLYVDDSSALDTAVVRLERLAESVVVETETRGHAALARLNDEAEGFDCVVSGSDIDDQTCLEFLEAIREDHHDLPVILYPATGNEEIASEAITRGVTDYLPQNRDADQQTELRMRIESAVSEYRADQSTAETCKRYEKFITSVSDTVCILSETGTFTYLSPSVETWLGYTPQELRGENGFEYLHPEDVKEASDELTRVLTDPSYIARLEFRAKHKDGSWSISELRGRNYLDDPHINGLLVVIRDIGERKQAETRLQTHTTKITRLHEVATALTAADTSGTLYQRAVDGAVDVFQCDFAHIAVVEDNKFVPTASSGDVPPDMCEPSLTSRFVAGRSYKSGNITRVDDLTETRFASAGESDSASGSHASPETTLDDGDSRSNTDSQGVYRALLSVPLGEYGVLQLFATEPTVFNDRDEEIGTLLSTHVCTALAHLDADATVRRERDRLAEFADVLSHDIRSPLNVAQGRLQMAREMDASDDHLAVVARSLDRIERLTENILTLARQGVAVGEPAEVALDAVAQQAWTTVETGSATLEVTASGRIDADGSRLEQVFENLYRNAIEHGGETVTVTVGQLEDGFYVEDTGPGIPPDQHEQVFESGHSTNDDGTGFGLAIVDRIVEAHRWEIDVSAGVDGGARFEITDIEIGDGKRH